MTIRELFREWVSEEGIDVSSLPDIEIEKGCIDSVGPYMKRRGWSRPLLIMDRNTKEAAGASLYEYLQKAGINPSSLELEENTHQQVLAEESSLLRVFLETEEEADVLIAVGTGTIHDIARFCSKKMNLPFLSVPTAASVDGFTSKGAPLIIDGFKKTIQSAAPEAVFADLTILSRAPRELTAAGFGDMLGKYTSLLDWDVSAIIYEEPYNEQASRVTRACLDQCIRHIDEIGRMEEKGLRALTEALIYSGLVMLILDFSRPASGGEHHLSHYWEMQLLKENEKQLLHGAKVGVASTIISVLYREWVAATHPEELSAERRLTESLKVNWKMIRNKVLALPDVELLQIYLLKVGGPATFKELGLSENLVEESLNEAHHLRERGTLLKLINHYKTSPISVPDQPALWESGGETIRRGEL